MPKVSIIIPTYNSSRTIGETLDSVFRQTYTDFEVLLINDGSTDNLMEALAPFRDPRLQVFHYKNGGLPVARNRGIDRATGEYLIFLDADDLWADDKIASHVQALDTARTFNPRAGVVYSWNYFLDDVTHDCFTNTPSHHEGNVLTTLLTTNFIANGSNPMVSREAIDATGRFREDLISAEDWDYWIKLAHRWDFVLVPQRQVFYRQIQTSMSSRVDKMERAQVEVIRSAFQNLPANLQPLKKIALSNVYFYCAQLYSRRHQSRESTACLRSKLGQSIVLHPRRLLQRDTQILILKWFLLQTTSQTLFNQFLSRYRQAKARLPNPSNKPFSDLI